MNERDETQRETSHKRQRLANDSRGLFISFVLGCLMFLTAGALSKVVEAKMSIAEQVTQLGNAMDELSLKIDGMAKAVRRGDHLPEELEKAIGIGKQLSAGQMGRFQTEIRQISADVDLQERSFEGSSADKFDFIQLLEPHRKKLEVLTSLNGALERKLEATQTELQQAQRLWGVYKAVIGEAEANVCTLKYLNRMQRPPDAASQASFPKTQISVGTIQVIGSSGDGSLGGDVRKKDASRKTSRTEPAPTDLLESANSPGPPLALAQLPQKNMLPAVPNNNLEAVSPVTPGPFAAGSLNLFFATSPAPTTVQPTGASRPFGSGKQPSGKSVTPEEAAVLQGRNHNEPLYLHGKFVVTASGSNRAVLRQSSTADGRPSARVIVEYPEGAIPPQQGSGIAREDGSGFEIREVRRSPDGQVNIYVREVLIR